MSNKPQPTPEEVEIIRKFCKHSAFRIVKDVEFLKEGENQMLECENCGLEVEHKIQWDKYLRDVAGEMVYCDQCGCRIKRGEECKAANGELAHNRCEWGHGDNDNW